MVDRAVPERDGDDSEAQRQARSVNREHPDDDIASMPDDKMRSACVRRSITYPGLDIVRLSAALMVTFYHLGWFLAPQGYAMLSFGWVGVEIFFVISGFVIAFSSENKSVGAFVKSRVLRLYPAAIICSTIIALVSWPRSGVPSNALLLYLKSVIIFPVGPWINQVFWTLPIEIMFYSLIAISVWRGRSLSFVALLLGAWSTAYWIFRIGNVHFYDVDIPDMSSGKFSLLLLHYGIYFALGILIYLRRHLFLGAVFIAVGFIAAALKSHDMHQSGISPLTAPIVWLLVVGFIAATVRWNGKFQWIRTRTLGLATYPLYLLHSSVGVLLFGLVPFPMALAGGVALAFLSALAVLPIERTLKRLLPRVRRSREIASLP